MRFLRNNSNKQYILIQELSLPIEECGNKFASQIFVFLDEKNNKIYLLFGYIIYLSKGR